MQLSGPPTSPVPQATGLRRSEFDDIPAGFRRGMDGGWHRQPRDVRNLPLPAAPPRKARSLRPYILRALHQATLLDPVRCAAAMVIDEVGAGPKLHATFQDGRDHDVASVAALGATRLQHPGRPLPQRLPIQWNASAGRRQPG